MGDYWSADEIERRLAELVFERAVAKEESLRSAACRQGIERIAMTMDGLGSERHFCGDIGYSYGASLARR